MAAQYELLKELLNSGTKLSFGQDFFFKFYQAFLLKDRWMQYINGVGTTLLVTALALALGVVLGSVVALVRVTHAADHEHGHFFQQPQLYHGGCTDLGHQLRRVCVRDHSRRPDGR